MIFGDCFPLGSSEEGRQIKYPFSKIAAYWCALITAMSAVLVLIVLPDPLLLVYYFVFTFVLTVILFKLKLHFLVQMEKSESSENHKARGQRDSILLILIAILFMSLPIILLAFLPPVSWFICLNVFVSSVSLSEVVLFYYARRN
jgi:hypothetical protein